MWWNTVKTLLFINGAAYEEPYLSAFRSKLTDGYPLTSDFTMADFGVEQIQKENCWC